jgi:hypothetical protein
LRNVKSGELSEDDAIQRVERSRHGDMDGHGAGEQSAASD